MDASSKPREFLAAWEITDLVQQYKIESDMQFVKKSAYDDLLERYELACNSDNAHRELSEKLRADLQTAIEALENELVYATGEFAKKVLRKHKEIEESEFGPVNLNDVEPDKLTWHKPGNDKGEG